MPATDGTTPLNAANVLWKAGEDTHTGLLTNAGNITLNGGYITVASNAGTPLTLETHFTLGTSYLILPLMAKHAAYPAAVGTYYYPTSFSHSLPFGGVTDIEPITFTPNEEASNNCTVVVSGAATGTNTAKRCVMLTMTVTTRNQSGPSYNPYWYGYVAVSA
jgi:hypothetical protein